MTRIRVDAVDPSSLRAVRDLTDLISADAVGYVDRSLSSSCLASGQLAFMSSERWTTSMIRITAIDTAGQVIPLGTFFATPQDESRHGDLVTGTLRLDGPLLGLDSAKFPSTYAASTSTTSRGLIMDVCRLCGRQTDIDPALGSRRYLEPIFYEAGSSCLTAAEEAADRSGCRLGSDSIGYITLTRRGSGGTHRWTTAPGLTTITSSIDKSGSWRSAPNRVIATYSGSETTLAQSADLAPDPRDSQTTGRHIDEVISVSDLIDPTPSALRAEAQRVLHEDSGVDEWRFSILHDEVDAGDICWVHDSEADEILRGRVESVRVYLDPILTTEVVVRGRLAA